MIVVYFTKGLGDVVADELEDVAPGQRSASGPTASSCSIRRPLRSG